MAGILGYTEHRLLVIFLTFYYTSTYLLEENYLLLVLALCPSIVVDFSGTGDWNYFYYDALFSRIGTVDITSWLVVTEERETYSVHVMIWIIGYAMLSDDMVTSRYKALPLQRLPVFININKHFNKHSTFSETVLQIK